MLSKQTKKLRATFAEPGDEIVISGIAGRFPNSNNVAEFAYNLYNKIDMVDDDERRWRHTNPEIPKRLGKVNGLEKFDASFFGIHSKQAQTMDPQCRVLLEHAYEVVLDAGFSPKTLRGSRTGVFLGCCFCESEKVWIYDKNPKDGLGLSGNSRALLANRISFSLGLQGPSMIVDTACSSSMYALDCAYSSMQSGECDAAIVGGANLLLHPFVSLQFAKLGVLAANGFCRPFDQNASGYSRAESINVIFLQRRRDARRLYANLLYSKINCDGFKNEGLHYPSGNMQMKLLKEFYEDVNIPPSTVDYVEAHSTGTIAGDPEECKALDEVFCTGRDKPLPVGSVKSNMGHAEASSGTCSVAKILIAFENQMIPPNINYETVRQGIPSLVEGRLKVVDEPTPLEGPLICVNSFGFGGANAHALFKSNPKAKVNRGIPADGMPRLVVWSGRTEEAINAIVDSVTKQPLDAEYVALLQHSQLDSVPANIYRGYGVFAQRADDENAVCVLRDAQHFSGIRRPVVWVYSGMGSQWCGMGRDLMKIPIFESAIEKCHKKLLTKGLNLKEIITSSDATMFDNILHSFVGIAAIQIGLTDILRALGLEPDHIIGHSVGELGCAYADGCFTAEEMVMAAYSRGMASLETKVEFGSMAAIGVGYTKLKPMLPQGVEIACHNNHESSTISGPAEKITAFVGELKSKGIFAKEVACSNIPFHSSYIAEMGPRLMSKLNEVVKEPKKRSPKWISSSYAQSRWGEPQSQYSSAQYHTNNLLSPVLFEEASTLLPKDSLVIEIAPHGLLQAILKRTLPDAVNISMTQRSHKNNDQYLFGAIGKVYANGFDLNVPEVYPKIDFPVARGTPIISSVIKWDHSEDWFLTNFGKMLAKSAERNVKISLTDPEFEFVSGHLIDGRCLFPATGYLFLAWETLATTRGLFFFDFGVEFEDVKFLRATNLTKDTEIELVVVIQPGSGKFEISEGNTTLVSGVIRQAEKIELSDFTRDTSKNPATLYNRDFYKELRLRGYHYNGLFRSVMEASGDGLYGKVKWDSNWIAFLDCLLQIHIVGQDTRSLNLPTSIQRMVIDTPKQLQMINDFEEGKEVVMEVFVSPELKTIRCGGIEIVNLQASVVGRRRPPGIPVLEYYIFLPFHETPNMTTDDAIRMIVQSALENVPTSKVKAVEVDGNVRKTILENIRNSVGDLPLVTSDLTYLSSRGLEDGSDINTENVKLSTQTGCFFIIASDCINNFDLFDKATTSLADDSFFICRENIGTQLTDVSLPENFKLISSINTDDEVFIIVQHRKKPNNDVPKAIIISETDLTFEWIEEVKAEMKKGPTVLVAQNEKNSGLIGLFNCLRKEPDGLNVRCVFIDDSKAPKFNLDNPYYQKQLELGLAINVLRNGKWGCYRHLQILQNNAVRPVLDHCYVNALVKSDLSSLKWINGPFNYSRPKGELVKVQYAALNFRDVMLATGKLSADVFAENRMEHECVLGIEYSGLTASGRRVMGMTPAAALATHIEADNVFNFTCPDNWTLEEAVTVPCVYGTVYAAFFLSARIEKGKSVLVHAGSGGVGLAAIRVAFAYGLEVFTTVSTEEKKQYLLTEFPKLKKSHIGNSRDLSFEKMILLHTGGKGVDYVLNSLSEEKLQASIRCLGKGGKFLEIGKFDMANDTKIGLGNFLNELSFHAIMVDKLFKAPEKEKMILRALLERDMKSGIIKPLKTNVFEASHVEQAFRFLASGKHMGKVLLKIRDKESDPATLPISVVPRVYCSPDLSYIIPGGLGGFGLELADWLVLRGCRKLVLSSSRGITKQYQAYRIKIWESYGVVVKVDTSDISTKAGCETLIREAMKLGPVGGIFNLAVVLQDSIFDNQDVEKFVACMAPKAVATKHLDAVSQALCPELQYFVVFSSVSCGRGNAGQSNYGMANSVMEKIIEQRHNLGLPAKAIQWGAVGEVGLVADMQEDKLDMEIGGTLQQRISSCLEEMDRLMSINQPIVSSMVVAEKRYSSSAKGNIIDTVMNIMGIRDIKLVSLETTLTELGMDSLMAVELKQIFEREYEISLTTQELRALTFMKIMEFAKAREASDGKEVLKSDVINDEFGTLLMRYLGDETYSDETILRLESNKSFLNSKCPGLLIPGIEGIAGETWYEISRGLNFPTSILQLKKTSNASTLDDMIKIIENDVINYYKNSKYFHLIAHSFGSYVALKLAEKLEQSGKVGRITFIDGAPNLIKTLSMDHYKVHTDEAIQNSVIGHMFDTIFTNLDDNFVKDVFSQPSWMEKCNKIADFSCSKAIYGRDFMKLMMNALVNRIKIVLFTDIKISTITKSRGTLLRPKIASVLDIKENYDLDLNFKENVDVMYLEGNHFSILENRELLETINNLHSAL